MKILIFSAGILTCCLAASLSAENGNPAAPQEPVHHSRAELKQLQQDAHTPEQYRALASYFEHRKLSFQEQATQEKKEWERRSQFVSGPAAKYPRPVDSARYLYEYYAYEAGQAGTLEARYEHLADPTDTTTAPTPTH